MTVSVNRSTMPFAPFEWMLAGRYLRTRRREGFVSVIALFSFLGIMLGVATLIIVLSVMNGFRRELLDKIVGINGHIFVSAIERPLTDYAEVADRLSKVYGIRRAIPLVEGQAFASSQNGGSGVLVRGVRGEDIGRISAIADNLKQGTIEGFEKSGGVAVGRRVAEGLGLQAGDTITLISPRGAQTPFGMTPRIKSYPITAIFEIGMSEFDATFVYMPMAEAQSFFNKDGDVTVIEIFLDDADKVDDARSALEQAAERPIVMSDWRQRNRTFFSALEVERNVMFLILTLIVLVAALNIVSGLIMLVKDKSSDIAILRTMGATRGAIMRIFLVTGASIGVVGTLAGFALGLAFSLNVESIRQLLARITGANLFPAELYFLSRLPAEVNGSEVATVVTLAMVLSLLATLYPSWKAARLDPVQALRYG
ncbi:lipoprotein-releasing ABC transporter permease subunit [uncultured Enterovirga sp.]|uniref:lipoprotein-releasing ABC transporter permease subunit n=1 Tax=uncultured Enterovirga sp. TaxID=2026352 RepID=UPI0035CB5065